jgi:hypothetical protein
MKLLWVLENGRFQRLGSNVEQQVSVRVISATNADLPALIRAGQFREDLYYRLNVIEVHVPALADGRATSRRWPGVPAAGQAAGHSPGRAGLPPLARQRARAAQQPCSAPV